MVRGDEIKIFWTPDIYIPEVKRHEYPTTTVNTHLLMIYIESDTTCRLKLDSRLAAVVACQMDFHDYPFDKQFCPFRLRSHYYPISYVNYEWSDFGVSAHKFIKLNNYKFAFAFKSYNNTALVDDEPFSWLEVDFIYERKLSNFIVQVVCPSLFITTVAYANFWVGVETGASRFQMTIVTLLSLVTLHVGVKATIPPISYVAFKVEIDFFFAVDIWMIFCLLFVWLAAMELAASNYLHKRRNRMIEKRKKLIERRKFIPDQSMQSELLCLTCFSCRHSLRKLIFRNPQLTADKQLSKYMINGATFEDHIDEPDLSLLLDKIFRVFYPLAFLVNTVLCYKISKDCYTDLRSSKITLRNFEKLSRHASNQHVKI
ncbi:glycine receptor subunit alpha-2-like protein [Leptotrombidium deliense]|uniref:Glycine receptor subunit alpha-2-like protein n=1 Tax=Leptotrombidium deliense TaxID=299467 RepID=A0A443SIY0_9ACAR|nr:glycine receptor subunit alpha-2-like protein [Leptotrombidium deliense]